MDSIFHRTSVRTFLEKPVEPEKIEKLMRAAMASPSAGNQQPWEFYIVENQAILERLAQCSPYAGCVAKAPLALVSCYRKEIPMPEYGQIDTAIATEHILLEARMQAVGEVIGLPDTLRAFAVIACGYPAEQHPQKDRYDAAKVHKVNE